MLPNSRNSVLHLINYLETQSKVVSIGLGIVLVILIGLLDYLIPFDFYTYIFYLIPIFFTTWLSGRYFGIFISIISAIVINFNNEFLRQNQHFTTVYWNTFVLFVSFLINVYIIYELKLSWGREKKMARTDDTTGMPNKRSFYEFAELEIKRSRRYGHPFTVAYINLDNFKKINDSQGHKVGDYLLKEVATIIQQSIRETDVFARLGGDEFALLLPGLGYEPSHFVISRLQKSLLAKMAENRWPVTFSIGAITFMESPCSVEDMIEKADYLMYCVKTSGKNRLAHTIEQAVES